MNKFQEELTKLLNKYSQENTSNTPDFVLAVFLIDCLKAWNVASLRKEHWFTTQVVSKVINNKNVLKECK